jgi:DNA modification methylase
MAEKVVIGSAELWHGDALHILPGLGQFDAMVSDPPYPNGEGLFVDSIAAARAVLCMNVAPLVLYFWSEIDTPTSPLPLVAKHIWHRTNVNGKIYEPALHFAADGVKRRSEIKQHAAIFDGAGPGCNEYEGHPTQKPVAVMTWLLLKAAQATRVLDPFMGSGSTGVACALMGRAFTGIERERKYFDIACERIARAQAQGSLIPLDQTPVAVQQAMEL